MKIRIPLIILCIFILTLLAGLVSGVAQDSVVLNSPADGVWTNLQNYTQGYNFTYLDSDGNHYGVTCSLYVGNQTNLNLLTSQVFGNWSNLQQTTDVGNGTTNVFYQNNTFGQLKNDSIYYWTVKCGNSTATPSAPSFQPTARSIKLDRSFPAFNVSSTGFTNNTWLDAGSIRFEIIVYDDLTRGEDLIVYLMNVSNNAILDSGTISNDTLTNLTFTVGEGAHTLRLNVTDPANNSNSSPRGNSAYQWNILVDTTTPAVVWNDPANNTVSVLNYVLLNWSVTERNLSTIILDWDGTEEPVSITNNCTGTAPALTCTVNKTGVAAKDNMYFNVWVNDSADNRVRTANQTINFDLEGPQINYFNWTLSYGNLSFRFNITDTTPNGCWVNVLNLTSGRISTVTGTLGTRGTTQTECTGVVEPTSIGLEGNFFLQYNVTDEAGNQNVSDTDQSGAYKTLAQYWNVLTQVNTERNLTDFCNEIDGCTQASYFNNSASSFTTYSTSTPTVNGNFNVPAGDAIMVYVTSATSHTAEEYLPNIGEAAEMVIVYNGTWNQLGLIQKANVSAVMNAVSNGTTDANLTWASKYDIDNSKYFTCKRSSGLCASAAGTIGPTNMSLPLGYAAYVLTQTGLTSYTINRSTITG